MKASLEHSRTATLAAAPPDEAAPSNTGNPAVLTLQQAAAATGRNPELLRRWCVAGRIRARRVGRDWLVSREELGHIAEMPRRGQGRLSREIDVADREVLGDAVNEALDGCLDRGEDVRVALPGVDDSALVATDRRLFLVRDGVLVTNPQTEQPMAWPLESMRRVQAEIRASIGALIVLPRDTTDRALVVIVGRPQISRAEAAADALRGLIAESAAS